MKNITAMGGRFMTSDKKRRIAWFLVIVIFANNIYQSIQDGVAWGAYLNAGFLALSVYLLLKDIRRNRR